MGGLSAILGLLIGLALPGALSDHPLDGPAALQFASASARHVLPVKLDERAQVLQQIEFAATQLPGATRALAPQFTISYVRSAHLPVSLAGVNLRYQLMSLQR